MQSIKQLFAKYGNFIFIIFMILAFMIFGQSVLNSFIPNTANWKTDFQIATVPMDDFVSGGIDKDDIRPINAPLFVAASDIKDLKDRSPVLVVEVNGEKRAYPLMVLTRHEIVNDTIQDRAIAVTFCPLCNSGIVYNRTIEGQELQFGVSGNLRNNGLVMWDNHSESWWQQFTGECLVGAYSGQKLEMIPSQIVGFGTLRQHYPDTAVLVGDEMMPDMHYEQNYLDYGDSPSPLLFTGEVDQRLAENERILAGWVGDTIRAYPFSSLQNKPLLQDQLGDKEVVIFWQAGASSSYNLADIDEAQDIGMAAIFDRELADGRLLDFEWYYGKFMDKQTGSTWNIFGEATQGALKGQRLRPIHASTYVWFAWSTFYPETDIYQAGDS
ncbi:DUF3179 domain-containing protein [Anaerolineales bacterium]